MRQCSFSLGGKTAWNTSNAFSETITAFSAMVDRQVTEDTFTTLQQFVVLLYDVSRTLTNVNTARQVLFARTENQWRALHLRRLP
jgi:hypothetical protein